MYYAAAASYIMRCQQSAGEIFIFYLFLFSSQARVIYCMPAPFFPPVLGGEVRHIVSISLENGKEGAAAHGTLGMV